MKLMHVVISSTDPSIAARLAASLSSHLPGIVIGHSLHETRAAIARHRAIGVVVDLETLNVDDVEQICREFPRANVVCTHRLADEQMWTAALGAGAVDCCYDVDVECILRAVGFAGPAARIPAA
jgi:DNA-binding NarL/FixJ family response regulator